MTRTFECACELENVKETIWWENGKQQTWVDFFADYLYGQEIEHGYRFYKILADFGIDFFEEAAFTIWREEHCNCGEIDEYYDALGGDSYAD